MSKKSLCSKPILLSICKKGALFCTIFFVGFLVSGFYFQNQSKPSLKISGFPVIKQKGYTLFYDGRAKVPLWTHEHLTKKHLVQNAERDHMHFYENQKINPLHRSSLNDYYRSGYDRGHMVPARDQQYAEQSLRETFLLSNICPQNPELNRGYWAQLENYARGLVMENDSVDIVTGPLYLPEQEGELKFVKYQVIGDNNVSVPTHFYKVIQMNTAKKNPTLIAFLVPNAPIAKKTPVLTYQVSIEVIEKATGLTFENVKKVKKSLATKIEAAI